MSQTELSHCFSLVSPGQQQRVAVGQTAYQYLASVVAVVMWAGGLSAQTAQSVGLGTSGIVVVVGGSGETALASDLFLLLKVGEAGMHEAAVVAGAGETRALGFWHAS